MFDLGWLYFKKKKSGGVKRAGVTSNIFQQSDLQTIFSAEEPLFPLTHKKNYNDFCNLVSI